MKNVNNFLSASKIDFLSSAAKRQHMEAESLSLCEILYKKDILLERPRQGKWLPQMLYALNSSNGKIRSQGLRGSLILNEVFMKCSTKYCTCYSVLHL